MLAAWGAEGPLLGSKASLSEVMQTLHRLSLPCQFHLLPLLLPPSSLPAQEAQVWPPPLVESPQELSQL